MAKLRRSTHDRPDLTEIRQPTCYERRDPVRPWLALDDDSDIDGYEDIELARHFAAHGPIATHPLGTIAIKEEAQRISRPTHQQPALVSLRPVESDTPRVEQQQATEPPEPPRPAYPPMRLYVHTMNDIDAYVELLGDPGVLAYVIPLPGVNNQLRLVADLPRWMPTDVLCLVLKHHPHNIVRVCSSTYINFLHRRRLD